MIRLGGNHVHAPSGNPVHASSGNPVHAPSGNHVHAPSGNPVHAPSGNHVEISNIFCKQKLRIVYEFGWMMKQILLRFRLLIKRVSTKRETLIRIYMNFCQIY